MSLNKKRLLNANNDLVVILRIVSTSDRLPTSALMIEVFVSRLKVLPTSFKIPG